LDIPAIYIDSNQNIWVASWYNGIYILKKGDKRFINISTKSFPNKLKSNRVVSFSEDSKGIIWIGTFLAGLASYDLEKNSLKHYDNEKFQSFQLQNGNIRKVIVDSRDNVWLGTRKGVYKFNPKDDSLISYNSRIQSISNNTVVDFIVFSMYEDAKNTIWIGTDGYGLISFSNTEDRLIWHGAGSDLRNMSINSITQTYDGSYWLGTDNGLLRYDDMRDDYRLFESTDGLLSKKINRSAFYTEQNKLYLGSSEGINYFNFSDIPLNESVPKIILQKLKIGNQTISVSNQGTLTNAIQYSDTLELNHNQSSFSIEYIGVNQTRGEKNEYAYMLKGLDNDWNYVKKLRIATFTNIKPGDYTFKLKASNNDGVWTKNSKDIYIKVLPPWWATLIAKISYLLIFCFVGFFIIRLTRLRVKETRKAELEKSNREQTEELNAKKIQFFTNISHEFRTPLTLILNPLETLLSSPDTTNLPDEVRSKHRIIHRNTKRLKRLIDELMDFRKMQFGKIQLNVKETSLNTIVDNVTSYYEEEALYRNIKLDINLNDKLKYPIWVDTSMLEKIVFNLLSNAFKATKEGGSISVSVKYHEEGIYFPMIGSNKPESAFEIVIKDSGIGIKNENIQKIFERFYQDKENNEQYIGGTGIGLEVVRRFVDYHKGKIEVQSKENIGTTFKIFLAAGNSHFTKKQFANYSLSQPVPIQNVDTVETLNAEKTLAIVRNHSILIVEDNKELREYLMLELRGSYKVYEASNGKVGFEMAKKFIPDVIIADIMMPKMDGIEMSKLLKSYKTTSNIPIMMLTAKVAEKERIEGIDAGADVYLKKPFSINLFKSHLRQLIKSKNNFFETYFKSLDIDVDSISSEKKILADVLNVIGDNLSKEDLCVQDIANELGLSRSKLYRKIKSITGNSANEIIRNTRLEKAKELLSKTDMTIGEICFKVGFASPSYFTKRFKEYTGSIPKDYRLNHYKEDPVIN
jgi:signal transduction histidine kinase/AraC-like DNA-binding protein